MAALLQLGLNPSVTIDVLDLRHVSGTQVAPLLRDEAARWAHRFRWDYAEAVQLLEQYIEGRVLPGFVALDEQRRVLGYTFSVYEANKAVLGDVWAFEEGSAQFARTTETLLEHMLETLEASPGVDRIESQLLMFPAESLRRVFERRGFQAHPRLFMLADLDAAHFDSAAASQEKYTLEPWTMDAFTETAEAIYASYAGHEDAMINDQYQSVAGAERFVQNIIRFPGCGAFDPSHSLLLRDRETRHVEGALLCSRVQKDTAHITQLCLLPQLQGRGLGAWMLASAAEQMRRNGFRAISLTVTETNQQARKLYDRFGFATMHRFAAMTWDRKLP